MNEIKELCELTLDVPAPPLRDASTALAMARRATRRRDGLTTAVAACVVLLAAFAVAVPVLRAPVVGDRGRVRVAAPAPATGAPAVPAVPDRAAAIAHGPRIFELLLAAMPSGYTGRPEFTFGEDQHTATWVQAPELTRYGSLTNVVVSGEGGEGALEALLVRDDQPATSADLCTAAVAARLDPWVGSGSSCTVRLVGGVPVRVTTRSDPDVGPTITAVRLLDGGLVAVTASQGRWDYDVLSTPPPDATQRPNEYTATAPHLTRLPFSADELAVLAANPAMLP